MNIQEKERYKSMFREPSKKEFIRDLTTDHKFYTKEKWTSASQQFLKKFLKGKPLGEYAEEIYSALDNLLDLGVDAQTVQWILYTWKGYLIKEIEEIASKNKELEYASRSKKNIYDKNRKTLVPKIKKIISSFNIISEIILQTPYNSAGTYESSISHSIEENHSIHNIVETSELLKELSNYKVNIKTSTRDNTEDFYKDFLHIEILPIDFPKPLKKINITIFKESWEYEAYFQTRDLKHLILQYLRDQYGNDAEIIGVYLLEENTGDKNKIDDNISNRFNTKTKPKNRPENIELNRIIIHLDDNDIDEIEIARLVNMLENKERYKFNDEESKSWSSKENQWIFLSKQKVKKAIRQRIKTLGSNFLKYQILNFIKNRGECTICDWKYNERGNIIRIPCPKHTKSKSFTEISFVSPNWQNGLLRKGLDFYANALTFVSLESKSKNLKQKKN